MHDVAGAYHKLIACSWVPILQVGGLGKVRVNCFPKAITTWLGRESNQRPPDPESDALTTLPRCHLLLKFSVTTEDFTSSENSTPWWFKKRVVALLKIVSLIKLYPLHVTGCVVAVPQLVRPHKTLSYGGFHLLTYVYHLQVYRA